MAGEVVLDTAVVELVANTEGLRRDLQRASNDLKRAGREMQSIGRDLTAAVTLPLVGLGAAAFKAAADFETAMTGVAKTVDAPAEAIAGLGESFRDLSERIPVATNELAKLAELGGQLGIEFGNLEGFVETMAALGVSTNLSAEEAGTALARLANIMGTSQTEFDRLGSVIVDLGNNLATTEREIVAFSTRMAGAGQIAGLTESDILAIGGALSSVGVEAEAGGTAVQKVLIDINTAVAEGNESLALFARTAGMSAQEFQQAWRQDAGAAFVSFVEGLGAAGDGAVTILSELGLENQRLIRSFLSLANAGPLLADALGLANRAWEENTALTAEAARFYDRMAARLQQLRNQAVNVAAEFGQALAPGFEAAIRAARGLLDIVRDLVEIFQDLPEWVRVATVAIAGLAAAIGPAAFAIGTLVQVSGTLVGLRLVAAVAGWTSAFASLAVQVRSLSGAFALLQVAIGPTGWIIAGLGLFTTAVVAGLRQTGRLRRELREMEAALEGAADAMGFFNQEATRASLENFSRALVEAQAEVDRIKQAIEDAPQGGLLGSSPQLQTELAEANRKVEQLEKLVGAAAQRWTQGFGAAVGDTVRSLGELTTAFEQISIGGFDVSELDALVSVQSELQRIVEDTARTDEERLNATRLLAQVTAEVNRLRQEGSAALALDEQGLRALLDRQRELFRIVTDTEAASRDVADAQRGIAEIAARISQAWQANSEAVRDYASLLTRAVRAGFDHERSLAQLGALHDDLAEVLEDETASWLDQLEAAEQMAEIAETIADEIERIGRGTGAFGALDIEVPDLTADLRIEVPDVERLTRDIGSIHDAYREATAGVATSIEDVIATTDAVVRGFVSIADAMGLASDESRTFVRALSDILGGLQAAQGAQSLASVAGIGGIASIAGGIAGLLGSILDTSVSDRFEEERRREIDAQHQALSRANDQLRDFAEALREVTRLERDRASAEAIFREEVPTQRRAQRRGEDIAIPPGLVDDIIESARRWSEELDDVDRIMQGVLGDVGALPPEVEATVRAFVKALEAAEAAFEREQERIGQNLRVRALYAQGLDAEARALERQIEIADAMAKGWTQANIDALKYAQALEETARLLDLATDFLGTFGQELQSIFEGGLLPASASGVFQDFIESLFASGDFGALGIEAGEGMFGTLPEIPSLDDLGEFDPFRIVQRFLGGLQIEEALAPFEELVDAGKITQAQFDALAEFMHTNLDAAIEETIQGFKDAADAAAEAAEAERFRAAQDLRSLQAQLLEVQGRTAEARALRDQIELLAAIEDGRSAEYIATLRQLQAAREHARRVEEQRKAQRDLNRELAQTTTALNAPAGLRLSLHRWRAMLADSVDIGQQTAASTRQVRQVSRDTEGAQEAARVSGQVSADVQLVEPEALMVEPVLELVPPPPLEIEPQIHAVAPEVFVEMAAAVQPVMDVGQVSGTIEPDLDILETETLIVRAALELAEPDPFLVSPEFRSAATEAVDVQPDVDVADVSATLEPIIELLQGDPLTFEPDIRLIQPDPLFVEPELILGSGLSPLDGGRVDGTAAVSTTTVGDTFIDESRTYNIDRVLIERLDEGTPEEFVRKLRTGATRVIRKGGADPLRRVRP